MSFFFVICQPGNEAWVKRDVAARNPRARFAFSRPGFVTFRLETSANLAEMARPTPLARAFGLCQGPIKAKPPEPAALARLRDLPVTPSVVHAIVREPRPSGTPDDPRALEASLAARLAACDGTLCINAPSHPGQWVFDVIEVEPGVLWTGVHRHGRGHRPTPGGRPPFIEVPPEAPSRVWSKIEEALWWSDLPLQAGELVLDIGCAPGGGTWNLLGRGARVLGVDPADMAAAVANHPRFVHRPVAFERLALAREEAEDVRWLVFDVNLSPMLTLKNLANLACTLPNLQGALITLKLNQPEHLGKLDWMLARVRAMNLVVMDYTQLYYNRQELCVYALRPDAVPHGQSRPQAGG